MIEPRVVGSIKPEVLKAILLQTRACSLLLSYDITVGKDKGGLLSMPCTSLCEKEIHRMHSRCFTCGGREVFYGKREQPISVTAHVVYEPTTLSGWRRLLAKKVRSLHSLITGI